MGGISSIISYMEKRQWKPTEEEREVMEAVWMQVKGACEEITTKASQHSRKIIKVMGDRYYL